MRRIANITGKNPASFTAPPRPLLSQYGSTLCLGLCLAVAASAAAQTTVEIDNAWVRVLRVKQAPHEKSPEQQHPDSVAVYLTDLGQTTRPATSPGSPRAKTPRRILPITPVEYVLVELKPGAPKAKGWPVELDPVKLEPDS